MAIIHRTTLVPSKMELLAGWLPSRPWYRGTGRSPELTKAGGFRLDDPKGEVGIEFMVAADGADAAGAGAAGTGAGGRVTVYHVPLTYRPGPLDGADDALIGMAEHGVLGRRWVYDGARDPVLVTQLLALIQGAAEPQAQSQTATPDPTVLSRPAASIFQPPRAFEVREGPELTELHADADGSGQLAVAVRPVLTPLAVLGPPGHGHVTATWRLPDGGQARGVFATVFGPT